MTAAQSQPGANRATGRYRVRCAVGVLSIAFVLAPLAGCLLPLASDLGMAHSFLHHHHLFKPVLPELPDDQPAGDEGKQNFPRATDDEE